MADTYDRYENEHGGGFMMGLLTGTVLGAGLGMLLAPRAGAELRGQLGEQARNLANTASEQVRRAGDTAGGWAERGREAVSQAREVVGRGTEQAREAVSRAAEETRGYAGGTTGTPGPAGGTDFGRS